MHFDHLDLFRFSDFELLLLFVLGVLCGSTLLTTLSPSKGAFAARPVEYSQGRGVSVVLVTLFHGASPVEYRLDKIELFARSTIPQGRVILYPTFSSSPNLAPFARGLVYPIP